jgi:hypothetical protein
MSLCLSGKLTRRCPTKGFDGQYIDGSWRPGKHRGVRVDTDPYSGARLAEMVMANQGDLDEAYHAAAKAQVSWAARLPAERAAVMLRSASIMEARHDEIVDWLIRESGSTRIKAFPRPGHDRCGLICDRARPATARRRGRVCSHPRPFRHTPARSSRRATTSIVVWRWCEIDVLLGSRP